MTVLLALSSELPFTALLNKVLGGPVTSLLQALGVHPHHPDAPFSNWMAMQILVAVLLLVAFVLIRRRLSVDSPGGAQHVLELLHGFVKDQSHEIIGHGSDRFVPFLTIIFLFIALANLIGLVPGFESPTANPSVPLGCAIVTFLYYNIQGIRHAGVLGYAKHFLGPIPAMAIIMLPIELISHSARLLSLTVRLWANIFAGDLVTLVFFSMIPIGVPVLFLFLHILVSFLQAYVFMLLSSIYLSGAVAEEH
jgi:F-type H+-transporting ATPase subunit a